MKTRKSTIKYKEECMAWVGDMRVAGGGWACVMTVLVWATYLAGKKHMILCIYLLILFIDLM